MKWYISYRHRREKERDEGVERAYLCLRAPSLADTRDTHARVFIYTTAAAAGALRARNSLKPGRAAVAVTAAAPSRSCAERDRQRGGV